VFSATAQRSGKMTKSMLRCPLSDAREEIDVGPRLKLRRPQCAPTGEKVRRSYLYGRIIAVPANHTDRRIAATWVTNSAPPHFTNNSVGV